MRDMVHDALRLRRIDEGALDTTHLLAIIDEHVATSDEILGACGVEDGA